MERRNLVKGILIGAVIVWFFMIGMAFYVYMNISSLKLFIPVAVLPVTLIPMINALKVLNAEIKTRSIK
ncbi:hypothetical protein ACR79T_04765 [Sphingobacterium spiritivorum]|uniref:hypothetical protein n=1 Tax=Sphingobacterium spiritivorum TaxID=258 RepID=UPI003DA2AB44